MRDASFVSDRRAATIVAGRATTVAFALAAIFVGINAPAVAAATVSAESIARDDQSLVEFTQAEGVTSAEHARLLREVRHDYDRQPARLERADAVIRDLLAKLAATKPPDTEAMRGEIRIRFALLPDSILERQIVENHDPSVIVDRARGRAVTTRTIFVIEHASQWLAKQLAVAGPGDGFVKAETADLRERFSQLTTGEQEACTHVARNMAAGIELFATLTPEQRASRLAKVRAALGSSEHSVPIDALAVLGMARAYSEANANETLAHADETFVATTRAMFHLQSLNGLIMGLQGEHEAFIAGPH